MYSDRLDDWSTAVLCYSIFSLMLTSPRHVRCIVLADHTNGRIYATVLRPSVVCLSSVTYVLRLTEKLHVCKSKQETAYGESNGHLTLKGQGHDHNKLTAQYLENSWRCCLAPPADIYSGV